MLIYILLICYVCIASHIGETLYTCGDYANAIRYFAYDYNLSCCVLSVHDYCVPLRRIAECYEALGHEVRGLYLLHKYKELSKQIKNKTKRLIELQRAHVLLGTAYLERSECIVGPNQKRLKRICDIHWRYNAWEKAYKHYERSFELAKKCEGTATKKEQQNMLMNAYTNIGLAYATLLALYRIMTEHDNHKALHAAQTEQQQQIATIQITKNNKKVCNLTRCCG